MSDWKWKLLHINHLKAEFNVIHIQKFSSFRAVNTPRLSITETILLNLCREIIQYFFLGGGGGYPKHRSLPCGLNVGFVNVNLF
jgi:predicted small integral membrane protein